MTVIREKVRFLWAFAAFLIALSSLAVNFSRGTPAAPHHGVWEILLPLDDLRGNPFFDVEVHFVFTLPDGSEVKAEGFFQGGNRWAGRAYCAQVGRWRVPRVNVGSITPLRSARRGQRGWRPVRDGVRGRTRNTRRGRSPRCPDRSSGIPCRTSRLRSRSPWRRASCS